MQSVIRRWKWGPLQMTSSPHEAPEARRPLSARPMHPEPQPVHFVTPLSATPPTPQELADSLRPLEEGVVAALTKAQKDNDAVYLERVH